MRAVLRTVARLAAAAVISGALATVVAPPASASEAATTATSASRDGQAYWADDHCHYVAQGGQWWSDMCMLAIADADGRAIPGLFGNFQNLEGGNMGRELVRLDLRTPGYLAFSVITPQYTLGPWLRVPFADPSRIEQAATTNDGRATWISLPTYPAAQPSGPPAASGNALKDWQIAQQWALYNRTLQMSWLLGAGASISVG